MRVVRTVIALVAVLAWSSCQKPVTDTRPGATGTVGRAMASDGVTVQYEALGEGEPSLVFVHGWSCDRDVWRNQMTDFAKRHRVIALDLGGHGESFGFSRPAWTMEGYGEDVAAVVEKEGLSQVVLVGHSMGGAVIIEAAKRLPGKVVGLVAVDTLHDVDEKMTEEQIAGFMAPMKANFVQCAQNMVRQMLFTDDADPALVHEIVLKMSSAPPEVALSAMEELFRYDAASGLSGADIDVWCINSDLIPMDLDAGRRYARSFQLDLMKGFGHFPMLEAPEDFNNRLEAAVQDLYSRWR